MKAFIVVSMLTVASVQREISNSVETPTCDMEKETMCKKKWWDGTEQDYCVPNKLVECWMGHCPEPGVSKYLVSVNEYQ